MQSYLGHRRYLVIGRPKVPLVLTTPEQQALDSLAHRARTYAPGRSSSAHCLLACARGLDNQTVAQKLRCRSLSPDGGPLARPLPVTYAAWTGCWTRSRPGAPRTITDDTVEAVIVRTLETTPDGRSRPTGAPAMTSGEGDRRLSHTGRSPASGGPLACSRIARRPSLVAVARPVAGREGARCRRTVSPPARSCPGAVCR